MIRQALRKKHLSEVNVETVENVQGNYNSDMILIHATALAENII